MKSDVLLASLFVVVATSPLMSMQQSDEAHLVFVITSHNRRIVSCSAKNMKFDRKPEDLLGKKILDVIPLKKDGKYAVNKAFIEAFVENKVVQVPYDLKGAAFLATITPIKVNKNNKFSIKVTPRAMHINKA
jgi:hypothetical protein